MDNFETPYDDETEFIECRVCEKSIRGDTLYKIHLTTPGHTKSTVFQRFNINFLAGNKHPKKEDLLVASELPPGLDPASDAAASGTWIAGLAVRQHSIPVFKDILQYLEFMKLDEPIIGLDYLEEVHCNDLQADPRYTCRLCLQTANLPEMVRHVIGRKHRQKYVELKRPDLVTWDKQSIITQGGKIIRARAVIIERQDGRGSPKQMPKKRMEGILNIRGVPPRQKQNGERNISYQQSSSQQDVPSQIPQLMDYNNVYSQRGRYPSEHPNTPPVHPEDPYMLDRDTQMYQREDTLSHDRMEEEMQRGDYRESDMYGPKYSDPDYDGEYGEEYVGEPPRRATLEPSGVPRYDSREERPHGQVQHAEYYPEEASSFRRPYPQRDQLKEFYSEEVRRGRVRSAEYQPSQPAYPEGDNHRWSLDRESGRQDGMNRAGRQESSEPEAKRRSFLSPMESDQSRDHLFNIIRDYWQEMREAQREDDVSNPGPSRTGPPASHRQVEVTRAISDMPEPFRRFLKGAANNEGHGQRKRKSRFSDATVEEVETTKEMFSEVYGLQNPKFGGRPTSVNVPLRPEIHGTQRPDLHTQLQSPQHTESYQGGGSDTGNVFDMLKNIEIDNAEEADYLKNKLCNLLKEFKTKKSERAGQQNSQGRAVISYDYHSLKPDPELSERHQYDTTLRQDSDLRRPKDLYFKDDQRGRGWQQREHAPDERLQEYRHLATEEPRLSNRSRYEEIFGRQKMSQTPNDTQLDEPARYPERFQEPIHPRDYRPAAEGFLNSHSSAPPLHTERGRRMDRVPRHSNNLDKITSTLLELVARK